MKRKALTVIIAVLFFIGIGSLAFNIMRTNEETQSYIDDVKIFDTELGRLSSLYVVKKDGKRGYISVKTREEIVKPIYKRAWIDDMETGLAACVNDENKLGFIDSKTGKTVIPFRFDFNPDYNIWYDYPVFDYVFCNGICIVPGEQGKLGIIDKTGKLLLPIEYVDIINWRDKNTPSIILKKRAEEDSDYKYIYGVCDRNFNMIVPFEYNELKKSTNYDHNGNIYVKNYIVSKGRKFGVLDTLFNIAVPIMYDDIEIFDSSKSFVVTLNGKRGVLDNNLKIILPIEYDWIHCKPDGNYIAKKNYVQKLYNKKGRIINECYIENREDVFSAIFEPDQNKLTSYIMYYLDGYYGVIEKIDQKAIIPAKYDNIEYLGNGIFSCKEDEYSFIINVERQ